MFVLTGPLPGIFLLAISHTAGEAITAYALHQPFNSASLIFSLILFITLPLALRISWEQRRTLAQEYADYREQVAESNRALARELHDTVARHISVIGLTTGQGLDAPSPSGKDAALHTIEEHTHKALTDMRLLIRTTRGDTDPTALPQTSAPTVNLAQTLAQARKDLTDHGFTLHENITITEADLPDGVRPTFHKLVQEICHNAKIIAVTTFDSYSYISQALTAGVHGYLLKNSRAKEIKQAVTAAVEGRAIIDRRALASLVISMNLTQPPQGDPWSELNATEQAITKLICLGHTNQEIAQELNYSLSNVKNTLSQVYKKMGVTIRTQLLVHAGHHNFPVLD